jgi:O-antigen/teichoic acid export membrane protein
MLPGFSRERWKELLSVTLPFAAASAVGTVYVYVSQIIMSLAASERATGIFGASFRIFIVLVTIPALMVTAALPILARAARDDETRLRYASSRIYEVFLTLGALTGLVVAASAPIAIDVVAGPKYKASVDVLRIHGVALAFSFLAAAGGYMLVSTRRHAPLLIANGVALVLSSSLTLGLGTTIGAQGAAIANAAGEAVLTVGYGLALLSGGLRFSAGAALKVAAATIPAAAMVVLLPAVPATIAATAIFIAILALLGGLPPEGGELLRRLRPGPVR